MSKLILSLLLISNFAFADCPKPVTYITKGTPVVCNGYLMSPEKEKELRGIVLDYNRLTELTKQQDELIGVMDKRLELQLKINQNLREQNAFNEKTTMTEKVLWFAAGVLVTGTGIYLLQRK